MLRVTATDICGAALRQSQINPREEMKRSTCLYDNLETIPAGGPVREQLLWDLASGSMGGKLVGPRRLTGLEGLLCKSLVRDVNCRCRKVTVRSGEEAEPVRLSRASAICIIQTCAMSTDTVSDTHRIEKAHCGNKKAARSRPSASDGLQQVAQFKGIFLRLR